MLSPHYCCIEDAFNLYGSLDVHVFLWFPWFPWFPQLVPLDSMGTTGTMGTKGTMETVGNHGHPRNHIQLQAPSILR